MKFLEGQTATVSENLEIWEKLEFSEIFPYLMRHYKFCFIKTLEKGNLLQLNNKNNMQNLLTLALKSCDKKLIYSFNRVATLNERL